MSASIGVLRCFRRSIGSALFMAVVMVLLLGWQQWQSAAGIDGNLVSTMMREGTDAAAAAGGGDVSVAIGSEGEGGQQVSWPPKHSSRGHRRPQQEASQRSNPHIIPISTLMGEENDTFMTMLTGGDSRGAADVLIRNMRAECKRHVSLPDKWKSAEQIDTLYNQQSYWFEPGLVCFDDRTRWYFDGTETSGKYQTHRPVQAACNRAAIELKSTAVMFNMMNTTSTSHLPVHLQQVLNGSESPRAAFEDSLMRTLQRDAFSFHRSHGILSVGSWGTVSIYHFLLDLVMGMTSLILSNPEWDSIPRDTIQMHENHFIKIEKWNLPPCFECLSVAPIVTDNLHQPNVTISFVGPTDRSMRCFCGATMVHHQTLTARAPCCSKPMTTRTHVSDVMTWIKLRLIEKWQFRSYGPRSVQYRDYAEKYGYWKDAVDPRKPRLLFLLRTKSRYIGRKAELMQLARDIGFSVHSMAFEGETMERQFAAGRYADVVVGTHGAALTSLVMMDTTTILCRSLIELFHWAPLGRIVHYQKLAYMVNVSALGLPPVDVAFGPSVRNPKKERKNLKSFSYTWSGTGFHDQTAFYDARQFRAKLMEAIEHLKLCPDVDLSGMASPPSNSG